MQKEDKDWHLQFRDERGKPTTEDIRDQIMTRINGDKINEPEAALIRDALHKVIEVGDVSLAQIPRDWNKAGAATWLGKPWDQNKVRKCLMRPRNAGLVLFRDEIHSEAAPDCAAASGPTTPSAGTPYSDTYPRSTTQKKPASVLRPGQDHGPQRDRGIVDEQHQRSR